MSDLLARLDTMIEGLTAAGSSRCSRSTDDAQAPTGTDKYLKVKAVPVVPVVPAEKQGVIREPDISRTEEQALQRSPRGEAPLNLSSKMTGTTVTTGTGQDFRGVERSRNFITNGNNGNYFIDVRSPLGPSAALDLTPISEAAFNERAAVLEYDAGLTRTEAEKRAAAEMGFADPAALYAAIAETWAERLGEILAVERSPRGRECIVAALRFIEGGWAVKALACGWTELELVGVCPVAPWARLDRMGAAFSRFTPIEITAEAIVYATSGAEPLRRFSGSRADGAGLAWERVTEG